MKIRRQVVIRAALAASGVLVWETPARGQTRSKGLDIAFNTLNWQDAANNGFQWAWVESSNGSTTRSAYPFNITAAGTATFMFNGTTQHVVAGTYHFVNPGTNTASQEFTFMFNAAGNFLKPGFLLPIEDLESGTQTTAAVSTYSSAFSDAMYAQLGYYPIFYGSESYIIDVNASAAAKTAGVWVGRPEFSDATAQTGNPDAAVSGLYAGFGSYASQPWTAWQYSFKGTALSTGGTQVNIDKSVFQGDFNTVLDFMTPVVHTQGLSDNFSDTAGWRNAGGGLPSATQNVWLDTTGALNTITFGSGTMTIRRLTTDRDNFIVSGGTLTLSRGAQFDGAATLTGGALNTPGDVALDTRQLSVNGSSTVTATTGTLLVVGGTLNTGTITINPLTTLTENSGQIGGVVTLNGTFNYNGGGFAGTLINGATFNMNTSFTAGGYDQLISAFTIGTNKVMTLNIGGLSMGASTLGLAPAGAGATAGSLVLLSNLTFNGASGVGSIVSSPGAGQTAGVVNLGNGMRVFNIADGPAATDFVIAAPIVSGGINKTGAGTVTFMAANSFAGGLVLSQGTLVATNPNQLGTGNITSVATVITAGSSGYAGTLQLSGSNSYNLPLTISGGGALGTSATAPGTPGALDNLSGTNTWSGGITLTGAGGNAGDPTLNEIGASGGTLWATGVISDGAGVSLSLAKSGSGDVVLSGASVNTYKGLTRVLGGRLIIEKDGALGAAGSQTTTSGNTFMLAGSQSSIAFRAPAGSSGFNYASKEWIHTDGSGTATTGQIDNLGGANTFSGFIALNGPVINSVVTSSIGVTSGSLLLSNGIYVRGVAAPRNINKLGAGTLILAGNSATTPTNTGDGLISDGVFSVSAGAVTLQGTSNNTANLPAIHGWVMSSGTTLRLEKNGALGATTVTLGGATLQMAASMTMANSLVFDTGGGTIDTTTSNVTFTGAVSGITGITKIGAGTLSLNGAINAITAGALTISAGSVLLGSSGATTAVAKVSSLSIAGTSQFNLNNNDIVIDYAPGNSPATTIRGYLVSGYNSGNWNGNGLASLAASTNSAFSTGLGYAENSTLGLGTFSGQTVDSSALLVKYTYYGDNNLDGAVNTTDFQMFLDGFVTTNASSWVQGDYTYDGHVDLGNDFHLFLRNYLAGGGALGELESIVLNDASLSSAQKAQFLQLVPEPGSTAILGAIAMAIGMRRRRK